MLSGDTIVAISSAVGPAARMIVRASGPQARQLAAALCMRDLPGASSAAQLTLRLANLDVPAWLYVFVAPRSYTGEDLVEFHIPGNALLARMLIGELAAHGARNADPGEFTARAYFNGRLDLTEAEGVAATIAAGSEQELRAARQLLAGELARRLQPARELIAQTLALLEVGIDFSDEDVTFLTPHDVSERLTSVDAMLRELLEGSARFERLSHEPLVVFAGRPNAGKSTLLNALAGHERAVTSEVAGTTRDVLTAHVALRRGIVKLADAAGIEERPAAGEIEAQMRQNALRAIESADVLVLVRDITDARPALELSRAPELAVYTKSDLQTHRDHGDADGLRVSAKTGENIGELKASLDRRAFGDSSSSAAAGLALNARHTQAIEEVRAALARALERTSAGGGVELVALELREALDALGRVVGALSPDDLLGRIFSSFCIGK